MWRDEPKFIIPILPVSVATMYRASSLAVMRGVSCTRVSIGALAMDDELLAIERIDERTSLCVSPLSRKVVDESEIENLGSDRGFFVYEVDNLSAGGISILAKVASLEAAFRLIDLFRLSRQQSAAA